MVNLDDEQWLKRLISQHDGFSSVAAIGKFDEDRANAGCLNPPVIGQHHDLQGHLLDVEAQLTGDPLRHAKVRRSGIDHCAKVNALLAE